MKLFEIKVHEPKKASRPARYRYTNCWLYTEVGEVKWLREVKREGLFPFVDGKCSSYQGEYEAEIVGEIDPARKTEADRIQPIDRANSYQLTFDNGSFLEIEHLQEEGAPDFLSVYFYDKSENYVMDGYDLTDHEVDCLLEILQGYKLRRQQQWPQIRTLPHTSN